MLYRVKQFIWAIKSLFQEVDNNYVNKLLDKREKRLFNKLKKSGKTIILVLHDLSDAIRML